MYHHCIVVCIYSTLYSLAHSCTWQFWKLQKPVIILRNMGTGEISTAFYALSTAEFVASYAKRMPPCVSSSLSWAPNLCICPLPSLYMLISPDTPAPFQEREADRKLHRIPGVAGSKCIHLSDSAVQHRMYQPPVITYLDHRFTWCQGICSSKSLQSARLA